MIEIEIERPTRRAYRLINDDVAHGIERQAGAGACHRCADGCTYGDVALLGTWHLVGADNDGCPGAQCILNNGIADCGRIRVGSKWRRH